MSDRRTRRQYQAKRRWLLRLGAIGFALSLFIVAELVCRLFGWGKPSDFDDPFVGFSELRPLFVLDENAQRYEIAPSRQRFFAPDSFPATKDADTFRIFCLGGSTVQGRPFSIETSFATWLRLSLDAADPLRQWQVINCGGISYASYRLVPVLKECLSHEPDLIILCTGHNEFLEDRTYAHIRDAPAALTAAQEAASRLRIYNLFRDAALTVTGQQPDKPPDDRPMLETEVRTRLDDADGLTAYHRDDAWRDGVVAHYRFNLRRMIALCDRAGVPVILIHPPSNLRDCPPFKSQHRDGPTDQQRSERRQLVEAARSHYGDDLATSTDLLERALAIDDQYAATWFALGTCYQAVGRLHDARQAFVQARDLDVCPLRMIAPLEAALTQVAADTDTPLLDAHALLESRCPSHILGELMLVDHVHPTFEGHQHIAVALTEQMAKLGMVRPRADWATKRAAAFESHLSTLDAAYFVRGQRELRALETWAGRRAPAMPKKASSR